MLRGARLVGIIIFCAVALHAWSKDSPILSYPEMSTDDDWTLTKFPNAQEKEEIIHFVKGIRGIDHRVQEIAIRSRTEVEVKTGRLSPLDLEKDRHGGTLLLRRVNNHWTDVERSTWSRTADKEPIYIWDGTSELAMMASVTDAATHKPISGATVRAVRVGGRNTEPVTDEHPAAMPPPQKTDRFGRATLIAYFRAAGDAKGFSVFVGDSFLQVDVAGYQPRRVRISSIVRLDFACKTKHCEVAIPVALTRR